jgi:trk system potassium uptake protein TrkH
VGSFLLFIGIGTFGFKALPGLYAPGVEPLGWIDALFTATSAVCVTGLIVVDTATYFSFWGQLFLLVLIQLGGLGMLGLASLIIVAFNARLSLRQDALAGGGSAGGAAQHVPTRNLVSDVILFTFGAEFVGFVALFVLWLPDFSVGEAAWHALFHSVSAFCNAGFSTFSDSLESYNGRPLTLMVIMGGVIVGGIGFLTLEELKLWLRGRYSERAFRLSLHTRLVLAATVVALVAGVGLLGPLEWENPRTLGAMSLMDKAANALFLAVTPRTAGFHTVDYGQLQPASAFGTILLMSIGGAPGGTAGGLKVTTIAVLAAMAYSRVKARTTTDVWDRTIPDATSQRAVGLFAFALCIVTVGILILCVTELGIEEEEQATFLDAMFEGISAFNTVGLSRGMTDDLSPTGRLLTVVLMFVGRVGPLTFAAALSRRELRRRSFRRFAHEDVVVG